MNSLVSKVERTTFHKIIESLSLITVIAIITDTVLSLSELPAMVPMHTGLNGMLDGFVSNKYAILTFSGMAIIALIALNFLAMNPSKMKYKIEITEENKNRQYSLATNYMKVLGLEIVMLFSYLQFNVTRATLAGRETIGMTYMVLGFIVIISTIIYPILSKRIK